MEADIIEFHNMLGNCGSDRLEKTAKIHDLQLNGEFKTCERCAFSKARQKNVKKDWKGGSQAPGQRLYLDISSVKDLNYGGSKFWALLVDKYRDYIWSILLKSKSDLKNKMFTILNDLKLAGIDVKFIRCDDSGKNKSFYDLCQVNGHNIKFQFSGPRTPQGKFQTIYGRIRATLNNGGLEDTLRTGLWAECVSTKTFLSNVTSIRQRISIPIS
jgi:hypothetical protein